MTIQPTLEIHPHQEFHFADNTDSNGCCCFWRSKPSEYFINEKGQFERLNGQAESKTKARIIANQRLSHIVESKFQCDPIESNEAFKRLKERVNHDFDAADRITNDKLIAIINAIYDIKNEVREESDSIDEIKKVKDKKRNIHKHKTRIKVRKSNIESIKDSSKE